MAGWQGERVRDSFSLRVLTGILEISDCILSLRNADAGTSVCT
jgi:hypothetical protein